MKRNRHISVFRFIQAWFFLHFARLVILFVPFRRIVGLLGIIKNKNGHYTGSNLLLFEVTFAISRASRFCLYKSKCFDQALAAKWILQREKIPSAIYFGVAKEPHLGLSAHSWVSVGDYFVVGGECAEKYTPLIWYGN